MMSYLALREWVSGKTIPVGWEYLVPLGAVSSRVSAIVSGWLLSVSFGAE